MAVAVTIGGPHGICDHINVVVVIRGLRRAWGSVLKTAGLSLVVHVVDGLRIEDRYVVTPGVKAVKKARRKIGLTPDKIHSPESFKLPHVQGGTITGHRLQGSPQRVLVAGEARVTIIALMRGGEPWPLAHTKLFPARRLSMHLVRLSSSSSTSKIRKPSFLWTA